MTDSLSNEQLKQLQDFGSDCDHEWEKVPLIGYQDESERELVIGLEVKLEEAKKIIQECLELDGRGEAIYSEAPFRLPKSEVIYTIKTIHEKAEKFLSSCRE